MILLILFASVCCFFAVFFNIDGALPAGMIGLVSSALLYRWQSVRELRVEQMIPPGGQLSAQFLLRELSLNAKELLIVDPYLFRCPVAHRVSYQQMLLDTVAASSAQKRIVIAVTDARNDDPQLVSDFVAALTNAGHSFQKYDSNEIHDRVWIREGREGYLVGTSLNGLGRRVSFITPLQPDDLSDFLEYLKYQLGINIPRRLTNQLT